MKWWMVYNRRILFVSSWFWITSQLCTTTCAQNSACLLAHWKPISSARVVILRPRVTVVIDKLFSSSESDGTADTVVGLLHATIAEEFEKKGYQLLARPGMEDWEQNSSNREAIKSLNDNYDSQLSLLVPTDCTVVWKASLKDNLTNIRDRENLDFMVVTRGRGTILTKMGKVGSYVGMGYGPAEGLNFSVAIVGASTGRVVFFCQSVTGPNYLEQPDKNISKPVKACLRSFFEGKPKQGWFQF